MHSITSYKKNQFQETSLIFSRPKHQESKHSSRLNAANDSHSCLPFTSNRVVGICKFFQVVADLQSFNQPVAPRHLLPMCFLQDMCSMAHTWMICCCMECFWLHNSIEVKALICPFFFAGFVRKIPFRCVNYKSDVRYRLF